MIRYRQYHPKQLTSLMVIILNMTVRWIKGVRQVFVRCNPLETVDGKPGVSFRSYIGFYSKGNLIQKCISAEISPPGTVGIEDPVCFGNHYVICVRTVWADNPVTNEKVLMPIQSLYEVNEDGIACYIRDISDEWKRLWCKGFIVIGKHNSGYLLSLRPAFDYSSGKAEVSPKIVLCWVKSGAPDDIMSPELIGDLILPTKEMPSLSISAPPVLTPLGWLLIYHRLNCWKNEAGEEIKEYKHYAILLDKKEITRVIGISKEPILTTDQLEVKTDDSVLSWILDPIYMRVFWYWRKRIKTIVSKRDSITIYVEMTLDEIEKTIIHVDFHIKELGLVLAELTEFFK